MQRIEKVLLRFDNGRGKHAFELARQSSETLASGEIRDRMAQITRRGRRLRSLPATRCQILLFGHRSTSRTATRITVPAGLMKDSDNPCLPR